MIGIYGGTFDPVHFGHLRPALDVLQVLQLDQVRFIPCGIPPHRSSPLATAQQRAQMVQLAIAAQPKFVLDDREITRQGKSYMVDTLMSLRQEFATTDLCLIVGIDAFNEFDSWKDWQTIINTTKLVIAHRPSYPLKEQRWKPALSEYVAQHQQTDTAQFGECRAPAVFFCPVTQLEISSTRIRESLSAGLEATYLLPASVIEYIRQHKLYC
jgi:nicotinate-nucleotide adenylyltransferase